MVFFFAILCIEGFVSRYPGSNDVVAARRCAVAVPSLDFPCLDLWRF